MNSTAAAAAAAAAAAEKPPQPPRYHRVVVGGGDDADDDQPPVNWQRNPPGTWHTVIRGGAPQEVYQPDDEDGGDGERRDFRQIYHYHQYALPPPPPAPALSTMPHWEPSSLPHYDAGGLHTAGVFAYKKISNYAKPPTPAVWGGFYLHAAADYKLPACGGRAYVLTDLELVAPSGVYMTVQSRLGPSMFNGVMVDKMVVCYQGNVGVMMYNLSDQPFYVSRYDAVATLTLHRVEKFDVVRLEDNAPIPRISAPAQAFYDRLMKYEPTVQIPGGWLDEFPNWVGRDGWGSGWFQIFGPITPGEDKFHMPDPKGYHFRRIVDRDQSLDDLWTSGEWNQQ